MAKPANNDYKNEDLKTVEEHEAFAEQKGTEKPISNVQNGSMAPNLEEIKQLGEDMEGMKTEEGLKKKGLVSDPIQHDSSDDNKS